MTTSNGGRFLPYLPFFCCGRPLGFFLAGFSARMSSTMATKTSSASPAHPAQTVAKPSPVAQILAAHLAHGALEHRLCDLAHQLMPPCALSRLDFDTRMRVLVKRILRKHGYPPDLQDAAVQTVLQQAEALSAQWAS